MRRPEPTPGRVPPPPPAPGWSAALAAHDRWLRLVVLARVGERQAVEEVMQELALAAAAARSRPDEPARLPAWLYRLAVRQALLYRRRCGRRRRLLDRYQDRTGFPNEADDAPEPLGWLIRDERAELVRAALRDLPPADAQMLLLKYADGRTSRDLADCLGVSVSAVEARLHRVRRRLRAALAASGAVEARETSP